HADGEGAGRGGRASDGAGCGVERETSGQSAARDEEGVTRRAASDGHGAAVIRNVDFAARGSGGAGQNRGSGDDDGAVAGGNLTLGVLHADGERTIRGGRAGDFASRRVEREASGQSAAGNEEGVAGRAAGDGHGAAVIGNVDFAAAGSGGASEDGRSS